MRRNPLCVFLRLCEGFLPNAFAEALSTFTNGLHPQLAGPKSVLFQEEKELKEEGRGGSWEGA